MGTPVYALRDVLREATTRLTEAGIDAARWDAEQLAAHVLGVSRAGLLTAAPMDEDEHATFQKLVAERTRRTPLQHLTGSVGFRHIDIEVGPGVFVPRPETEVVVGWAVEALRALEAPHPVVVDLCTGSAAIPLAIANEVPRCEVHAVEREPAALDWARRNAHTRAVLGDTPIQLHHGDIADAVAILDGRVDLVISNPPYVAEDELAHVEAEVRDHDPLVALVAGGDGLDVIRVVSRRAARLLRPGGRLVVEHSDRQGRSAPDLLVADGWVDVADHVDLTGRDRFATARKADA